MKNGLPIMDSDLHLVEPYGMWERYIDKAFQHRAPRVLGNYLLGFYGLVDGHMLPTVDSHSRERYKGMHRKLVPHAWHALERAFDAWSHLEAMDKEGLDIAALFPTIGLYVMGVHGMEAALAAAICRAYNNWLYDFCLVKPERLKGIAMIPPHDIHEAIKETRRAVQDLGFRGVFLQPTPPQDKQWHDRYFDPLWNELVELDVPLCFHEGVGQVCPQPGDQFGKNRLMVHTCCHPMSMMYACVSLIAGQVLEFFPKLRVAFFECGAGWVPFWLDRLDHEYELLGPWDATSLTMKPSDYFRRQCVVGIESEHGLKHVVDQIGDDNIVWSSDYPHWDCDFPHASEEFLALPVSEDTRRKILWDNVLRLYRLPAQGADATIHDTDVAAR